MAELNASNKKLWSL